MTIVLFALGVIATAGGLVTIGFGIPINAFSLGNTLIISGAVSVGSGLTLIGLASVLAQLKRVSAALAGAGPRVARPAESIELVTPPAPHVAPAPAPSRPSVEVPVASASVSEPPRAPEPRFPATASEPQASSGPLDWLRSKPASKPKSTPAEPPIVDVTDEAPLSPSPPKMRPPSPSTAEPTAPKVWSPSREQSPRATPDAEPAKEAEPFNFVWPDRPVVPSPSTDERPAETKREPALDMPLPPAPARPRDVRPSERRMTEFPRKTPERPAILKSGVIDGMPYTLYADGSIEAQLAQGTVKFASVDALRAHLEKQS